MDIRVPRLVRSIDLTEYAPELVDDQGAPVRVQCWVNPTIAFRARYFELAEAGRALVTRAEAGAQAELVQAMAENGQQVAAWYAELWSQHSDIATHWTAAQVLALASHESDPALFGWLKERSWALIEAHLTGKKKP